MGIKHCNFIKYHVLTKFFLIAFVLALMAFLPVAVSADVGIDTPNPGGLISPGERITSVKMQNEKVVFDVKQGTGPFASEYQYDKSTEAERYYAHVTATFAMQNLTDKPVSKNLIFPFHLLYSDESSSIKQAKNAKITINGKEVVAAYNNDSPFAEGFAAAGHFPATFAANATTTIVVEYDLRGVLSPKTPNVTFNYMMQTGSHWAGTIGHGEVIFNFDKTTIDSLSPFTKVNNFFKAEDGKLVWKFDNLEPTVSNDIVISFDPYILNTIWANRQKFITSLDVSSKLTYGGICGNTRLASPDCNTIMYMGDKLTVDPTYTNLNPVNMLTTQDDIKNYGWLIDYDQNKPFEEWLELSLDGKYTFSNLQIRSGFLDTGLDYSNNVIGTPGNFYDSFNRPKTVTVTFSDGSSKTTALKDTPADLQDIAIPNNATDKIRLTFKDTYAGINHGNSYFGVGRIKLVGAKKVQSTNGAESGQQTAQATNWTPYIIGGAVLFGLLAVGATTGAVWHRGRRKTASMSDDTAKLEAPETPKDQPDVPSAEQPKNVKKTNKK